MEMGRSFVPEMGSSRVLEETIESALTSGGTTKNVREIPSLSSGKKMFGGSCPLDLNMAIFGV